MTKCLIFDLDGTLIKLPIRYEILQNNLKNFFHTEDNLSPLIPSIIDQAKSNQKVIDDAFKIVCNEELIENAELSSNYEYSFYQDRCVEVSGFDYDDERKILSMIVSQYHSEDEIVTLTKDVIDRKFKRLMKFLLAKVYIE